MSDSNIAPTKSTVDGDRIRLLIADLANDDAGVRMAARAGLAEVGPAAVEAAQCFITRSPAAREVGSSENARSDR